MSVRFDDRHIVEKLINHPPKQENETTEQYYMLLDYLKMGLSRKISHLASRYKCKPYTLYAYAKKFRWQERSIDYDRNEFETMKSRLLMQFQEEKMDALQQFVAIQERANLSSDRVHRTLYKWDTNPIDHDKIKNKRQHEKQEIQTMYMVMRFFECYVRLTTNIDKQFKNIENYAPNAVDKSDFNLLNTDKYKAQLEELERQLAAIEQLDIEDQIKEIDKIEIK